ncbi:MAG TPA: formate dehydrogenase accessory sulfurtransferase FdhD [Ktedonobacteraceae bacterium]|jgi:FdhD protein|nr:formate dehydrogenase accessory sulfurtransferase FdhD [Ktedonobacteraceae bacterium]
MGLSGFFRSSLDPERVMRLEVVHCEEQTQQLREEQLTVEEPLEVRVGHQSVAVIMRTPGHDYELALGFLFSEGLIQCADEVVRIESELDADGLPLENVVNVQLRSTPSRDGAAERPATFERHFAVSSSCGLCGKNSIADILQVTEPLEPDELRIPASILYGLAEQLRSQQKVFGYTGGLHAAGLFATSGELLLLREDIGRHNAVDKLVGHSLLPNNGFSQAKSCLLLVSGRTSFEILQKALLARIPCVAAISAPSSMAVDLADKAGITLIGFLRGHAMNIYTHPERIVDA